MDTNLRGSFLCSRAALRGMLREKWGRIVNMSSAVAIHGNAGQTVYAATKAGLLGLTKSLAREVAAKGITVNALCPGLLETEMTAHLTDEARAFYIDQTPMRTPRLPGGGRGRRPVPDVGGGVVHERHRDPGGRRADRVVEIEPHSRRCTGSAPTSEEKEDERWNKCTRSRRG